MKRIFTALFCAAASIASAADLFVQEFGGGNTYPNISDAIAAASAGDRILVVPKAGSDPYIENLTIDKGLHLLSASNGGQFRLQGSVTISSNLPAGAQVVINGLRITDGSISAATSTNNISVSIVNCLLSAGSINLGNRIDATIANNNITIDASSYAVTFREGRCLGNVITATIYGISVPSGAAASLDTTHIVGNRVTITSGSSAYKALSWGSSARFFNISNNFFRSSAGSNDYGNFTSHTLISIGSFKTGANAQQFNNFVNNTISFSVPANIDNRFTFRALSATLDNRCNIINNLIRYATSSPSPSRAAFVVNGNPQISYNIASGITSTGFNTGNAPYGNSNSSFGTISYAMDTNGCLTSTAQQNSGHPDPVFTDLDLTRNDVGACGGSYNIEANFQTAGTAGSAKVHWLEAPRRVLQGGTLNIKAEGHDR